MAFSSLVLESFVWLFQDRVWVSSFACTLLHKSMGDA